MPHTLILNSDATPLSMVPLSALHWQDSITMEWLDRADVVDEYKNWTVRSPSLEMAVPSILMIKSYVKISKTVKYSRYNVFLRDNFICQYCGLEAASQIYKLTIDHFIPKHYGGKTRWDNVITACNTCNIEKGHKQDVFPAVRPYQPTYWELVDKRKKHPIRVPRKTWIDWIGWDPKLVFIQNTRHFSYENKINF